MIKKTHQITCMRPNSLSFGDTLTQPEGNKGRKKLLFLQLQSVATNQAVPDTHCHFLEMHFFLSNIADGALVSSKMGACLFLQVFFCMSMLNKHHSPTVHIISFFIRCHCPTFLYSLLSCVMGEQNSERILGILINLGKVFVVGKRHRPFPQHF